MAHVPELEAKQLALVAWGLAKLSEKDAPPDAAASRLLDAVAAASIGKADQFTAQARRTAGMLHASTGAKRHSHGRVEERMVRGDGRHPQTLNTVAAGYGEPGVELRAAAAPGGCDAGGGCATGRGAHPRL